MATNYSRTLYKDYVAEVLAKEELQKTSAKPYDGKRQIILLNQDRQGFQGRHIA